MSKLIKCSVDVSKIKKEHIFKGEKGQYINVDIWVDDTQDKFGNDASVKQSYKVGDSFDSHFIGNGKKGFGWDKPTVAKNATVEPIDENTKGDELNGGLPWRYLSDCPHCKGSGFFDNVRK